MREKQGLEIYQQYPGMFYTDFFNAGNSELKIEITPRNVQSGRWYEASWITADKQKRYVAAQWHKLVMERIIKQFLQDDSVSESVGVGETR